MKIFILLTLAAIALAGCGDCGVVYTDIQTRVVTPWQEKVSCPDGEVMLSAETIFWQNGQPKAVEIRCAKAVCR